MLKFLAGVAIIWSCSAQANDWLQTQKTVVCGPFRNIIQTLSEDRINESPLWIGQSSEESSKYVLFFNQKTGSWTLVQHGSVNACILGIGDRSDVIDLQPLGQLN